MTDDQLPATVTSHLEAIGWWAQRTPEAPALLGPGMAPVTYGELAGVLAGMAQQLRHYGVGPQDRVALLLPDAPLAAALLLGVAGAAIAVALNPQAAPPEVAALGARLRPRLTIASGAGLRPAAQLGAPVLRVEGDDPRHLRLTPSPGAAFPPP